MDTPIKKRPDLGSGLDRRDESTPGGPSRSTTALRSQFECWGCPPPGVMIMMVMKKNCTINPATPCLWQAPGQRPETQKENLAGQSSERAVGGWRHDDDELNTNIDLPPSDESRKPISDFPVFGGDSAVGPSPQKTTPDVLGPHADGTSAHTKKAGSFGV